MTVRSRLKPAPNYPKAGGTEQAERILDDLASAVRQAGDIVHARYGSDPAADLGQVLGHLQDALDHIAVLRNWDHPPDPHAYPLWVLMARRHLPAQGELYEEHYVPQGTGRDDAPLP